MQEESQDKGDALSVGWHTQARGGEVEASPGFLDTVREDGSYSEWHFFKRLLFREKTKKSFQEPENCQVGAVPVQDLLRVIREHPDNPSDFKFLKDALLFTAVTCVQTVLDSPTLTFTSSG